MELGWCHRGGLNSRPHPYQGCALPLSYCGIIGWVIRPKAADAQEQSRPFSADGVTFKHDGEITKTNRAETTESARRPVKTGAKIEYGEA